MSKLRERLRGAMRRGGGPLGFGSPGRNAGARRHLVVMTAVADAEAARAAAEAGADALLFEGALDGLAAAVQAAPDVPVGCRVDAATAADAKRVADAGADFFVFDDARTDAAALLDRRLGHVLQLPEAAPDDDYLRLLQPLDLDALLLPVGAVEMTVREQLQTRRIAQLAWKPLIVPVDPSASAALLEIWRNAGAPIVLVSRDDAPRVAQLLETATAVPPPHEPNDERPHPLLPRSAAPGRPDD